MARGKEGQIEKDAFMQELSKLLKAAMILDIFLYDKRAAPDRKTAQFKDFRLGINLLHTAGYNRRYTGCGYCKITCNNKEEDRTVAVNYNISAKILETLLDKKPRGFVKKIPVEKLSFKQVPGTEEELEWARFVITQFGIDVVKEFHLDEDRYQLNFTRTQTVTTEDTRSETVWAKSLEEALIQQNKFELEFNTSVPVYGWYYKKTIRSGKSTIAKGIIHKV